MVNTRILRYLTPILVVGVVGFHFLQTRIEHSAGVEAGQEARIGFKLQQKRRDPPGFSHGEG